MTQYDFAYRCTSCGTVWEVEQTNGSSTCRCGGQLTKTTATALKTRKGGAGQVGGDHYSSKIDPWELQRVMQSCGIAFVDARRADAIKYSWRMKGDLSKLLEDLSKARHCLDAAISELESKLATSTNEPKI